MTRVRTMVLGAALMAAGLLAPSARAGDSPAHVAPGGPSMPASPAEPERGPIRSFFYKMFHSSKTPRSGHSDWSTGRDDRLSKPWLQPPSDR